MAPQQHGPRKAAQVALHTLRLHERLPMTCTAACICWIIPSSAASLQQHAACRYIAAAASCEHARMTVHVVDQRAGHTISFLVGLWQGQRAGLHPELLKQDEVAASRPRRCPPKALQPRKEYTFSDTVQVDPYDVTSLTTDMLGYTT